MEGVSVLEQRYIDDEITLDLRQIFDILRKYLALILLVPLLASCVAGIAVFFVIEPVYRAETTLLVRNQTAPLITHADLLAARQLVRTYREIARSRIVAEEVITSLRLDLSAQAVRDMVDVTLRGDTEIIAITVENTDPRFASRLANAVAASFQSNTLRIMEVENITVVDTAVVPQIPVRPRKMLTVVLAGFVGAMAGLGLAFVLAYLDNTVKTPEDIHERLGLPLLGVVPVFKTQDFTKETARA
ncbi:MAG: putative capsular polysaccharide biosynthesis protein YwqC [Firmicutes bacterium]|nr:putative capsular polysaccharide biosynthesis protein YwqC [candidate division NPL-UPA2 bacterium]